MVFCGCKCDHCGYTLTQIDDPAEDAKRISRVLYKANGYSGVTIAEYDLCDECFANEKATLKTTLAGGHLALDRISPFDRRVKQAEGVTV